MSELFGKNLTFLRDHRKLKQAQMTDLTGVSRATWSDYERGKTEPDFKTLLIIAEYFGATVDGLLKEDLARKTPDVHLTVLNDEEENTQNVHRKVHPSVHLSSKKGGNHQITYPKIITIDSSGEENVLYVPAKARAGYLLGYGDPEFIETLPAFRIPGLSNGSFRIFDVVGHSMFNTLHDKDKVISRWDQISNIKDDRVYVLVTKNEGILVKRLINRYSEGVVICKSDNNYKGEYPPIILDVHDIVEVWYVTDRWTKQLPSPGEIFKRVIDLEADMIMLKDKLLKGSLISH